MALAGYSFWVLPDAFVIHIDHTETTWDGPSHHDQQWDSLMVVCDTFPALRSMYGYDPFAAVFDEPDVDHCYSNEHWWGQSTQLYVFNTEKPGADEDGVLKIGTQLLKKIVEPSFWGIERDIHEWAPLY